MPSICLKWSLSSQWTKCLFWPATNKSCEILDKSAVNNEIDRNLTMIKRRTLKIDLFIWRIVAFVGQSREKFKQFNFSNALFSSKLPTHWEEVTYYTLFFFFFECQSWHCIDSSNGTFDSFLAKMSLPNLIVRKSSFIHVLAVAN